MATARSAMPAVSGGDASKAPLDVAPPPVLARVEALVRANRTAEAITLAYQSAEADVRRAFGLKLPRQWTHRELIERYLRRDMGYLVTLLPRLYALYEPVRYGRPGGEVSGGEVLKILRAIYEEPSLRRLSWTIGADSTLTSRPATGATAPPPKAGAGGA